MCFVTFLLSRRSTRDYKVLRFGSPPLAIKFVISEAVDVNKLSDDRLVIFSILAPPRAMRRDVHALKTVLGVGWCRRLFLFRVQRLRFNHPRAREIRLVMFNLLSNHLALLRRTRLLVAR